MVHLAGTTRLAVEIKRILWSADLSGNGETVITLMEFLLK
jgi:hypothetical protein